MATFEDEDIDPRYLATGGGGGSNGAAVGDAGFGGASVTSRQQKVNRLKELENSRRKQRQNPSATGLNSYSTPKTATPKSAAAPTSFFAGGDVLGGGPTTSGLASSVAAPSNTYSNLFGAGAAAPPNGLAAATGENSPSAVESYLRERDQQRKQISETEKDMMARGIRSSYDPNPTTPQQPTLDLSDLRAFSMRPAPKGLTVQCQIVRDKSGSAKLYPKYCLFLENPRTFLLAARKRKKSRSSNYLISINQEDLARESDNYIGKLRSNFVGTEFTIYDDGEAPEKADAAHPMRKELCCVFYEANILGFKGPRKMTVLIPKVNKDGTAIEWRPSTDDDSMLEKYKAAEYNNLLVLQNKSPVWNEDTQSYVLNFNKRVTMASVKNFQIVHNDDPDYILMQFGRIGEHEFTMDYQYPMTAVQAFCIALSSFDNKLACE